MLKLPIYLDYNATTPCDPAVVEEMLPYFSRSFGNAASRHHVFGWQAAEAVEQGRERVAALVGAEPGEIVFTSGATESCNLAIKGVYETYASKGNHIITSATEHSAVLDACRHLERLGAEVSYLESDQDGLIDVEALEAAVRPATILIAVMYANNETGVMQPVRQVSAVARDRGVVFFCDMTQAVGKIPVDVNRDGLDLAAFSSHKIYGPKGVGALYVRRRNPRVRLTAQLDGGGHEKGMRSGTLNVPGIVGFGKACEICGKELHDGRERLGRLRSRLESDILESGIASVNGGAAPRLPHVSSISFEGMEGENLASALGRDVAVSSGSACSSASMEPSHVLKAMGLTDEQARSSVRFSIGRFSTEEEIDYVSRRVREIINQTDQKEVKL